MLQSGEREIYRDWKLVEPRYGCTSRNAPIGWNSLVVEDSRVRVTERGTIVGLAEVRHDWRRRSTQVDPCHRARARPFPSRLSGGSVTSRRIAVGQRAELQYAFPPCDHQVQFRVRRACYARERHEVLCNSHRHKFVRRGYNVGLIVVSTWPWTLSITFGWVEPGNLFFYSVLSLFLPSLCFSPMDKHSLPKCHSLARANLGYVTGEKEKENVSRPPWPSRRRDSLLSPTLAPFFPCDRYPSRTCRGDTMYAVYSSMKTLSLFLSSPSCRPVSVVYRSPSRTACVSGFVLYSPFASFSRARSTLRALSSLFSLPVRAFIVLLYVTYDRVSVNAEKICNAILEACWHSAFLYSMPCAKLACTKPKVTCSGLGIYTVAQLVFCNSRNIHTHTRVTHVSVKIFSRVLKIAYKRNLCIGFRLKNLQVKH